MNLASTLFCGRCSRSANTGTSQYAFTSEDSYKGFSAVDLKRSTREYHGGTESASPKSQSIRKNSSWKVALCLRWHLFCASAEKPDSTCARLSAALPHTLYLTSSPWVARVVSDVYNLVGVNCSKSSIIPAMVWIGASFLLVRQAKQPYWVSSSSSYLDPSNFPCKFSFRISCFLSSTSALFSKFLVFSLDTSFPLPSQHIGTDDLNKSPSTIQTWLPLWLVTDDHCLFKLPH